MEVGDREDMREGGEGLEVGECGVRGEMVKVEGELGVEVVRGRK